MPLSTSNFEAATPAPAITRMKPRITRQSWALLACALALYLLAEGAAKFGITHVSRIYSRILSERAAAIAVRRAVPGRPKTALFTGNSLLLEGLEMETLRDGLRGRYQVTRFVVEQTSYYDWLYGLKSLFRAGMRPDLVLLSLNPPQTVSNATRGDFSAKLLFDAQDIGALARDTGLDLTTQSSLYFAHYSTFFAVRSELRNNILIGKRFPAVFLMWQKLTISPAVIPSDEQLVPQLVPRLRALRELCASYGSDFAFLIPPTNQPGDTALLKAGDLTKTRVLRPVPNFSLPPEDYADQFHLNRKGSLLFTKALVKQMADMNP